MVDVPAPAGRTWHAKWKRPSGIGDVSSSNDRPGSTSRSVIACVPPAFVVIVPWVPLTNGPSIATARTSGFQLGQVLTSDQSRHTRSGLAPVSSVLPCDAIGASSVRSRPPSAGGPFVGTNGEGVNRHHHPGDGHVCRRTGLSATPQQPGSQQTGLSFTRQELLIQLAHRGVRL